MRPSSFSYGDQIYEPRNYKEEYHGDVTARYALAMSLNNATVKLAEEVGYDKVADLAKAAGIVSVKATPAMALGAYDATPVDMAAAYTVFANSGERISPTVVNSVRNANGDVVMDFRPERHQVLDARVAYLMTTMMEGVMNNGTAYRGPPAWLYLASGRKDWQLPRWLVRRLYQQPVVHCVGWIRRLQRSSTERSPDGGAGLGGVHEEGGHASPVLRRKAVRAAAGRRRCPTGQDH